MPSSSAGDNLNMATTTLVGITSVDGVDDIRGSGGTDGFGSRSHVRFILDELDPLQRCQLCNGAIK